MTVVSLLAIAVLVALGLLFVASERRRARQILRLAQDLETRREHEGACFHYAVAAAAGAERAFCEARVRELWAAFGPFSFTDPLATVGPQFCRYESCGRGYHEMTVQAIRRLVAAGDTSTDHGGTAS